MQKVRIRKGSIKSFDEVELEPFTEGEKRIFKKAKNALNKSAINVIDLNNSLQNIPWKFKIDERHVGKDFSPNTLLSYLKTLNNTFSKIGKVIINLEKEIYKK